MAIDFPNNPTNGDTYTVNGKTWQWDGSVWAAYGNYLDPGTLNVDKSNGRVGINNTNPTVALDVTGAAAISSDLTVGGDFTVSGTTTTINTTDLNVEDNIITLNYGVTGTPTLDAGIEVERGDLANTSITWDESAESWVVGGTAYVDTANGRVGIGTTSPAEELHVYKDQNGDLTQILIENIDQRIRIGSYYESGVGQYGKIQAEQDAGGDTALVLNPEGGNVGIGTTSPSYLLDVDGNVRVDDGITFTDALNSAGYITTTAEAGSSNKLKIGATRGVGGLQIEANQGRAMTVKYNTFVGFGGATDPLAPLHVKRGSGTNTGVGSGGNYAAIIYYATDSSTSHGLQVLNNWQADASKLLDMGSIAANSAGYAQRWYATGLGRSYNYYGTWGTISDETLKTEIVDANPQLQDILDLRFVNYKFIADVEQQGDDAPRLFGLIAQEVEAVSPGLVSSSAGDTEGDAKKTINTSVLSMKAVKAMQEMHALIETQQEAINTLTARIEALEAN